MVRSACADSLPGLRRGIDTGRALLWRLWRLAQPRGPPTDCRPQPDEAKVEGRTEGERKRVSVLFCDIVGSTGLSERIGAEAMHDLLDRFVAIAAAEVERLGGLVHKVLGDGLMALVGVPRSREDHAELAVLIALALRQRLCTEALAASNEEPLQVRIGVNSGLVVVGTLGRERAVDYTAVGDVVNVAARLQSLAEPGQILIGEATARLVGGRFQLESLGQTGYPGAGSARDDVPCRLGRPRARGSGALAGRRTLRRPRPLSGPAS